MREFRSDRLTQSVGERRIDPWGIFFGSEEETEKEFSRNLYEEV